MSRYVERFWEHVDVKDDASECWPWLGRVSEKGHGRYKGQFSHRLAVIFSGLTVWPGQDVHHTCETKACTNPMHLQVLRHSDHSRVTRVQTTKGTNRNGS